MKKLVSFAIRNSDKLPEIVGVKFTLAIILTLGLIALGYWAGFTNPGHIALVRGICVELVAMLWFMVYMASAHEWRRGRPQIL
jgi:hypothetical protein